MTKGSTLSLLRLFAFLGIEVFISLLFIWIYSFVFSDESITTTKTSGLHEAPNGPIALFITFWFIQIGVMARLFGFIPEKPTNRYDFYGTKT